MRERAPIHLITDQGVRQHKGQATCTACGEVIPIGRGAPPGVEYTVDEDLREELARTREFRKCTELE